MVEAVQITIVIVFYLYLAPGACLAGKHTHLCAEAAAQLCLGSAYIRIVALWRWHRSGSRTGTANDTLDSTLGFTYRQRLLYDIARNATLDVCVIHSEQCARVPHGKLFLFDKTLNIFR